MGLAALNLARYQCGTAMEKFYLTPRSHAGTEISLLSKSELLNWRRIANMQKKKKVNLCHFNSVTQ